MESKRGAETNHLAIELEGLERLLFDDLRSGKRVITSADAASIRRTVKERLAAMARAFNAARK